MKSRSAVVSWKITSIMTTVGTKKISPWHLLIFPSQWTIGSNQSTITQSQRQSLSHQTLQATREQVRSTRHVSLEKQADSWSQTKQLTTMILWVTRMTTGMKVLATQRKRCRPLQEIQGSRDFSKTQESSSRSIRHSWPHLP